MADLLAAVDAGCDGLDALSVVVDSPLPPQPARLAKIARDFAMASEAVQRAQYELHLTDMARRRGGPWTWLLRAHVWRQAQRHAGPRWWRRYWS